MASDQQDENIPQGSKFNSANVETSLLGFYNNMATTFKKYTANVPNPLRKNEGECTTTEKRNSIASGNDNKDSERRTSQTAYSVIDKDQTQIIEPEIPELPSDPKLPPGVLSQAEGNIAFKLLTEDYLEDAVTLLCNHFFKDEPLGKALYLESPAEIDHWLSKALPHMVRHEVSVIAVDESYEGKGKLIGISVNTVKLKGQPRGPDDFLTWINPQSDPKSHRIFNFLHHVIEDIDFYTKYNVDKLFVFELLNVDKTYAGRGIPSMLVEQSVAVAQKRKFRCVLAETTGIFSAKIFARNGFKTIKEVPYATQRENGRPVFPSTGIHTCARVSVKILPENPVQTTPSLC